MDFCDNKHRELSQLLELNVENHRRIYPTQLTRYLYFKLIF